MLDPELFILYITDVKCLKHEQNKVLFTDDTFFTLLWEKFGMASG